MARRCRSNCLSYEVNQDRGSATPCNGGSVAARPACQVEHDRLFRERETLADDPRRRLTLGLDATFGVSIAPACAIVYGFDSVCHR